MAVHFSMGQTYTAVVKRVDAMWIGWIEEIPGVNCQEYTREELLETLRITRDCIKEVCHAASSRNR